MLLPLFVASFQFLVSFAKATFTEVIFIFARGLANTISSMASETIKAIGKLPD
jgi:hypothetical protein